MSKMTPLSKSISLELNYLRERWISTLLFIGASALIVILFYLVGRIPVGWGGFSQLSYTYYDLLAPSIFPLLILFVTVQMVVLRIVGERAPYGTLDRELIAISRTSMYFGKFIVHFLIAMVQCLVIYFFGFVLLPIKNYSLSPLTIIFLFLLLALFGIALGLLVSIFAKHKEGAVQITPYLILALFVSSLILIFPNVTLSPGLKATVANNPIALISVSLSNSVIQGVGFEDITSNVIKMLLWIIVITIIGWAKFNWENT